MERVANGFHQGVGAKIQTIGVSTSQNYPAYGVHYSFWTVSGGFIWTKTMASHGALEAGVNLNGQPHFFPSDYLYSHLWLQLGQYVFDVQPLNNSVHSQTDVQGRNVNLRTAVSVHI